MALLAPTRRAERSVLYGRSTQVIGYTMDLELSRRERELSQRVRQFCDEVLVPFEDECEADDGLLERSLASMKRVVLDWLFNAINQAVEDGVRGSRSSSRCSSPSSASCASTASGSTSEIQRSIIGNELAKRGPQTFLGWPTDGSEHER